MRRLAWSKSRASTARWRLPPSLTGRPWIVTSIDPRSRTCTARHSLPRQLSRHLSGSRATSHRDASGLQASYNLPSDSPPRGYRSGVWKGSLHVFAARPERRLNRLHAGCKPPARAAWNPRLQTLCRRGRRRDAAPRPAATTREGQRRRGRQSRARALPHDAGDLCEPNATSKTVRAANRTSHVCRTGSHNHLRGGAMRRTQIGDRGPVAIVDEPSDRPRRRPRGPLREHVA